MGNIYSVDSITGDIVTIGSITAGGGIISTSTTAGFLPPQLTTTQRNAIVSPSTGLEIFNTTTNQPEFWNGSAWVAVGSTTGVSSITGTANEVIASASTGAVTLSLPQAISTSSTIQFAKIGIGMVASNTLDVTGTFGITATASTGSGTVMFDITSTGLVNVGNSTAASFITFNKQGGLQFQDAAQANIVGITAPATLSGSYDLILPLLQGAASTVLTNDGSGNLSWSPALTNALSSGNIFVGNGSNIATAVSLSGDATLSDIGTLTLDTVNSNVGSFTNANITVNAKGLITAASNGSAGGVTSITGTANQVIASASTGAITLSLPQSIATTSTPSFEGLHLGIAGSVTGILQFFNSGNGNAISLSTASGASNYSLQLPNLQGGTNTFLKNDGTGSLSFSSVVLTTDVSGTLPVTSGGTGDASFTAYSVITGGTTSTGALQSVSGVGTAGQILTSNGASALPTWQNAGSGSGTVNSGTAGNLTLYPSSGTTVSDTYVQNSHNITLGIAAQGSRSTNLAYVLPNPGNSVTSSNILIADGTQSVNGTFIFGGGIDVSGNIVVSSGKITGLTAATTAGDGISYGQSSWSLAAGSLTGALAMGSNKITGLANGTASSDAAAFGQIGGTAGTNAAGYIIGTIIQSVQVTDTTTTTSSGTAYTATATAASITPKASTHKIRISVTGTLHNSSISTNNSFASIFRGGTNLDGTGNGFIQVVGGIASSETVPACIQYLDSPATTSATTYTTEIKSSTAADSQWNNASGTAVILLEEIAA